MIYFLRCGKTDWVKIGTASDMARRFWILQSGSPFPLKLVAVMDGGRDREVAIHRKFAEERGMGEWFSLSPRLRSFIRESAAPATEYIMRPKVPNMPIGVI